MEYTIAEAKEEIRKGIIAYYAVGADGNYRYSMVHRMPFYLEGPPGIGKTEVVRQLAEDLSIGFVSFSVTHHTRNSLIGLPVISELSDGEKYTEYTMSEIIASVKRAQQAGHEKGILLLDEFNCASETIMPTMLAFLQTRNIGLYTLPDEWIMVLCGNPPEYNPHARQFGPALMDRVRSIKVCSDEKSFLDYAGEKNFHPVVRNFLKLNTPLIYRVINAKEQSEVVTNRGWENLSCTIAAYEAEGLELTEKTVCQYIKSPEIAENFFRFYWVESKSFSEKDAEQIILGKGTKNLAMKIESENLGFREQTLDLIEKKLLGMAAERKEDKDKGLAEISKMISNVFRFLKKLKQGDNLVESFYYFVTENADTLDALITVKNEDYLATARRAFAEGA